MKTRKLLLLAAFILFGFGAAQAQFTVGGKVGFNYASLPTTTSDAQSKAGNAGFNIGLFARLGNKTYFEPELLYTNSSSRFSIGGATYHPHFNQIEVPLLLGTKLIKLPLFNLHAAIGPSFAFNTSDPQTYHLNASDYSWKKSNISGVADLGVDIGNFVVDGRYNLGFTKITDGIGAKLGVFNLSIGWKFF